MALIRKICHPVAAVYLVCLLAHVMYVSLYAQEVPFWDQWDAEADHLFRPFLDGSLAFSDLLAPHNEHRIFFSRLLALALFKVNGHEWNNLVEAYASCAVYAAVPATLVNFASKGEVPATLEVVATIVACALAVLPFNFENTLYGFQSQFYFMAEFALLTIATATLGKPKFGTTVAIAILSLCSIFTMASGLIAPIIATATLWLRHDTRCNLRFLFVTSLALAAVALLGVLLIPDLGGHDRASGWAEHVQALSMTFMWPLRSRTGGLWIDIRSFIYAGCIWSPFIAWVILRLRSRAFTQSELFAASVALWVAAQGVAVAHARGHGMAGVPSRYTDILALGVLCNVCLACWLIFTAKTSRPLVLTLTSLFGAAVTIGLMVGTSAGMYACSVSRDHGAIQMKNVAAYLATNDYQALVQPLYEIPYPDPRRLQSLLDTPSIRSTMPATICYRPNWGGPSPQGCGPANNDPILSTLARQLQTLVRRSS